jgi:hypothetical protein
MTWRRGWEITGTRTRSSCDRHDQAVGLESEERDGDERGAGRKRWWWWWWWWRRRRRRRRRRRGRKEKTRWTNADRACVVEDEGHAKSAGHVERATADLARHAGEVPCSAR